MAVAPQQVILAAVVALLEAVDGTGTWTYDLTDRVYRGPLFGSDGYDTLSPVVGVYAPGQSGVVSTTRTQKSTLDVHVEGWVPRGVDYGATEDAAWKLHYDITRALVLGTGIRAAIVSAAVALGTTAPTGYNAVIAQVPTPRAHGDADTGDALLNLHMVFRVDFEIRLDGSA